MWHRLQPVNRRSALHGAQSEQSDAIREINLCVTLSAVSGLPGRFPNRGSMSPARGFPFEGSLSAQRPAPGCVVR